MAPTLLELGEAVSAMRLAQNAYFRSRSDAKLQAAKKAEAIVDGMLKALSATSVPIKANLAQQTNLFV